MVCTPKNIFCDEKKPPAARALTKKPIQIIKKMILTLKNTFYNKEKKAPAAECAMANMFF